ncbi:MAG: GAF domain-containing protein [Actinobacteria bacterium]|nr:MAG: GAF domain-containing protein [Actinomycetota bacterium]
MILAVSVERASRERGFLSAEQAFDFLDGASEVLARSLDYEQTLEDVARLAVPDLADWCAIDVVQDDGSLRQITSRHPDPAKEELLLELRRRFRARVGGGAGVAAVVRTGEPEHVYDTGATPSADIELSDEERELYAKLAPRSYLIVPLITRARTLGALTLLSTREGRHYGAPDVRFARHLARRFALAIDSARLFEESRAARARAEFLVRAGEIFASSLDYEKTLQNVAEIAVPELVDWCTVQLRDEDGSIKQVAAAHADPAKVQLAWELQKRFPPDPEADTGAANVIRTGVTEHYPEITDQMIDEGVPDLEFREIVKGLGIRATIVAPLRARGEVFGAVTFVSAESGRRFTPDDISLVEEIARRAGMAADNARRATEDADIAHKLQAALLPSPRDLPAIPNVDLATQYNAAGQQNEVGGDFYDVFATPVEGEWIILIGDVSGKGAEAAAVTALARYTVRAAALESSEPSELLQKLNAVLLAQRQGREFCTACIARVVPWEDTVKLRCCLAGHPSPILLPEGGGAELIGTPGTLLGMFEDADLVDCDLDLGPGDGLVFYTDGVIEAGRPTEQLGDEGLAEALAEARPETPFEAVHLAETVARETQRNATRGGSELRDDVALVAIRVRAPVAAAVP